MFVGEKRAIALQATRERFRSVHILPEMCGPEEALRAIDELARLRPDLVASQWYKEASDHQIGLFWQEWSTWAHNQKLLNQVFLFGNEE